MWSVRRVVCGAPARPYRRSYSTSSGVKNGLGDELSFALITPESLAKARTGGIIARLLSKEGLRLVGARMYAPSRDLQAKYVKVLERAGAEDGYVDHCEQVRFCSTASYSSHNLGPD